MYTPSFAEVQNLTSQGKRVPLYREILADLETPVSAFRKVARGEYSFLFESMSGGEQLGRYSFIGTEPYKVLKHSAGTTRLSGAGRDETRASSDPLQLLLWELEEYSTVGASGLPRFCGGAVGYLGLGLALEYAGIDYPAKQGDSELSAQFLFTDTLLVFDHFEHKIKIVSHVWPYGEVESSYAVAVAKIEALVSRLADTCEREDYRGHSRSPEALMDLNISEPQFTAQVEEQRSLIKRGELISGAVPLRVSRPYVSDPFNIYRVLRTRMPAPYMYFMQLGELSVIGASPEVMLRLEEGRLSIHPATSLPGGATQPDGASLSRHQLHLDVCRNNLSRVCQTGTIRQGEDKLISLVGQQLILGEAEALKDDRYTQTDCLRACFPSINTLGAPLQRALQAQTSGPQPVAQPFGGAVGYFDFSGNLDMATAVNTLTVCDGLAVAQTGTNVDWFDGQPASFERVREQAAALMAVVGAAESI